LAHLDVQTLIEVSSEGQRLESKVFTFETQLKQDVLDLADEQFQRVDHIMKSLKGSNAKVYHSTNLSISQRKGIKQSVCPSVNAKVSLNQFVNQSTKRDQAISVSIGQRKVITQPMGLLLGKDRHLPRRLGVNA
jgi:trans-2-enoyl-CoA reductase